MRVRSALPLLLLSLALRTATGVESLQELKGKVEGEQQNLCQCRWVWVGGAGLKGEKLWFSCTVLLPGLQGDCERLDKVRECSIKKGEGTKGRDGLRL